MEKIVIQFVPELNDYSRVIRSFLTRKRLYWVGLGVIGGLALICSGLLIIDSLDGSFQTTKYLVPLILALVIIESYPLWGGWLTLRSASKKENLILPARYELDEENMIVISQMAEAKYDWKLFTKAFEDGQYYMITYSTNKNMFQFIPKRAFNSLEQEAKTRELIVRQLGKIEDTGEGLTRWGLAALTAVLTLVFILCVIGLAVLIALI